MTVKELHETTERLFKSNPLVYVNGFEKGTILAKFLKIPRYTIESLDTLPKLAELRKNFDTKGCPIHEKLDKKMLACTTRHTALMLRFN